MWPELPAYPALKVAAVRTTHAPAGSTHCAAQAGRMTAGVAGFQGPPCHLETEVRLCKVPVCTSAARGDGLHCSRSKFLRTVSLRSIPPYPHAPYPSIGSGGGYLWVIFLPFPSFLACCLEDILTRNIFWLKI